MSEIVPFYTTYNMIEAELMKTQLDSEGIPCFISADDASGILPHLSMTNGIRIMIRKEDEERAWKVLENLEPST